MFVVRVGSTTFDKGGEQKQIEEIIPHPMYDAVLLRLKYRLLFSSLVQPVALVEVDDKIEEGELCLASGWGRTAENEPASNHLKAVELPFIDHENCQKIYEDIGIDTSEICAGYSRGGGDSCSGDSGGPLVYPSNGPIIKRKLIGIVSEGVGCARSGLPGMYVDIRIIRDWIEENAKV